MAAQVGNGGSAATAAANAGSVDAAHGGLSAAAVANAGSVVAAHGGSVAAANGCSVEAANGGSAAAAVPGAGGVGVSIPGPLLYVGNLDASVTSGQLYDFFSDIGVVYGARVCEDSSRRPLGYGFVEFMYLLDAEKAVQVLNGILIYGRPLVVSFAHKQEKKKVMLQAPPLASEPPIIGRKSPSSEFFPMARTSAKKVTFYRTPPIVGRQAPSSVLFPMNLYLVRGRDPMDPFPSVQFQGRQGARIPEYSPVQVQQGVQVLRGPRPGLTRSGVGSAQGQQTSQPLYQQIHVVQTMSDVAKLKSDLTNATNPDETKRVIGEHLYLLLKHLEPKDAGRVTGMLQEMYSSEYLLRFLKFPDELRIEVIDLMDLFHTVDNQSSQPGHMCIHTNAMLDWLNNPDKVDIHECWEAKLRHCDFTTFSPDEQSKLFGPHLLYPLVAQLEPKLELAEKLTDMLARMNPSDVIHLLKCRSTFSNCLDQSKGLAIP